MNENIIVSSNVLGLIYSEINLTDIFQSVSSILCQKVSKRWTLKKIMDEYILDIDNSRISKYTRICSKHSP